MIFGKFGSGVSRIRPIFFFKLESIDILKKPKALQFMIKILHSSENKRVPVETANPS